MIRDGVTYRERPDLGTFKEGVFESIFVEIIRGRGRRNDVVGVVYRPPGGQLGGFNTDMAQILGKLQGKDGYVMGDFNVDLVKSGTDGPTSDYLEGFTSGGFYPLVSLPTRLTDISEDRPGTATLIDNIWTNNLIGRIESGLVTVRLSDHLPIFAFVGGAREEATKEARDSRRRVVNERRIGRFAEELEGWCFDEERALGAEGNVARFRNGFRDM